MHHRFLAVVAVVAVLLSSSPATATPQPPQTLPRNIINNTPSILLPRQNTDTCSIPGSKDCGITESKYCCPASTECLPLENRTSVICCPTGSTCSKIKTITCAAADAGSSSKTAAPPKCGTGCCPVGYECAPSGDMCLIKPDNLPSPSAEKPKTEDATREACQKILDNPDTACPRFPAAAITVGFFPGIVIGALLMALWTKFVQFHDRRRSIKSFGDLSSPSTGTVAMPRPPPPQPMTTTRSDAERALSGSSFSSGKTSMAESVMTSSVNRPSATSSMLGPVIPPLHIAPKQKLTVDIVTAHQSYSTASEEYNSAGIRYTKSFYVDDMSPGLRARLRSPATTPDYPYVGLHPAPIPRRSELRVVTEEVEGEDGGSIEIGFEEKEAIVEEEARYRTSPNAVTPTMNVV